MSDQAVVIREIEPGIVQITMQDRVNKNTFSRELAEGLIEAFASIRDDPRFRVAILTGYDTYFASGGTKEGLLFLSEGKAKFSDRDFYSLALNCPIPVIAAMQGHGVGGGFVLGMFADFPILSRESIYTTNFMKYGFTPGMGSTFVLPKKLGISLAEEMMITARTYRGEELQKRGVPFPVLPRAEIMDYALELARTIAEKPRVSLVTLKDHLVAPLREGLSPVIDQEVAMHEKTFHQPEVKERIEAFFGN
ncbi:MAG TPA: polyketide synthase [Paucimonas sp.]|nr:polyketide synthase [Paucimonas sp.]